jgi:hypothetical protein
MAVVTSTRNFARNLGSTLGLAVSGTIVNTAVRSSLNPFGLSRSDMQVLLDSPNAYRHPLGEQRTEVLRVALSSAYQKGFRVVFIVGAVLNALAFVAIWFQMTQVDLDRKDDAQLKAEGKRRDEKKRGITAQLTTVASQSSN